MMVARFGLLAALTLALGACAGALSSPPAKLYTLNPATQADPSLPQAGFQLLVETPVAGAGLDTQRIAVEKSATAIDYLSESAWTDRAPAMIQGLIVQSFEDSRKIVSVGRDSVGLRSDFVLRSELRDFEAEYSTPGAANPDRVHVRIAAKLVGMPRRTIEAGETFEAIVPIRDPGVQGVVTAFDAALRQVMERMVAWTLRTGTAIAAGGGTGASGASRGR
ncbi:ABC-type transport auxiliary lipoprotein family protein [Azospirillum sp.]|uniref:ABC-type transport auxiliary lipoprotein family protein n=1 Tax=Azospirillum sp. TaxID=34012 RepID=UPI003D73FB35